MWVLNSSSLLTSFCVIEISTVKSEQEDVHSSKSVIVPGCNVMLSTAKWYKIWRIIQWFPLQRRTQVRTMPESTFSLFSWMKRSLDVIPTVWNKRASTQYFRHFALEAAHKNSFLWTFLVEWVIKKLILVYSCASITGRNSCLYILEMAKVKSIKKASFFVALTWVDCKLTKGWCLNSLTLST